MKNNKSEIEKKYKIFKMEKPLNNHKLLYEEGYKKGKLEAERIWTEQFANKYRNEGLLKAKDEIIKLIDEYFEEVKEPRFELSADKFRFIKWLCEMEEELTQKISKEIKDEK